MTTSSLPNQIAEEAAQLTPADQQRALDFVRVLATGQQETPADVWRRFAGLFLPEDLDEMERAIDEGCENIDPDEQ